MSGCKWFVSAAALVAGFLVCTQPAQAQNDPYYRDQVLNRLSNSSVLDYLLKHNYRILENGRQWGYVYMNRTQDATFYLEEGYTYGFTGVCDEDCNDMDFTLYDPHGNKVTEDTQPDSTPAVLVTVGESGTYTVRSVIPRCNGIVGCYWAVQAVWK